MRILHLEDDGNDAELIGLALKSKWPECEIHRARDRQEFENALQSSSFDIILSDFQIPSFGALEALEIVRQRPSLTPFIIVSGTIGEIKAADCLKRGARDYILKDTPHRLIAAVERALSDAVERIKQEAAKAALQAPP